MSLVLLSEAHERRHAVSEREREKGGLACGRGGWVSEPTLMCMHANVDLRMKPGV